VTILETLTRQTKLLSGRIHAMAVEKRVIGTLRSSTPQQDDAVDFILFFADGPGQRYQLEQWLVPFESLADRGYGVCVVVMNSLTAKFVASSTRLPILLSRSMETIESLLASWGTSGIFYVNNSQANFTMLRVSGPAHVHLSHGESEKSSMVSNQLKAYDFAFIAGEVARSRIINAIPRFDASKLVEIGRPQLDVVANGSPPRLAESRVKVLYAPTWEGDGKNMDYSSIARVGLKIVTALLSDERFTVIFRPHPKTGSWSATARQELANIRKVISAASSKAPAAGHHIDQNDDSGLSILEADIVICDISAIAMDAVGLDKPMLLLHSENTEITKELAPSQTLLLKQAKDLLDHDNTRAFGDELERLATAGVTSEQRSLQKRVFGSPSLGHSTDRFIEAAARVAGVRQR
jgi:hypothetical protein